MRNHHLRSLLPILFGVVTSFACGEDRDEAGRGEPTGMAGLPAPSERFVVLSVDGGRVPRIGCSGWEVIDSVGFTPNDSVVRALDARVVAHVESLFVRLRRDARFSSLSPAAEYVRQYAGIERAAGRYLYVHAFDPGSLASLPGVAVPWDSVHLSAMSLCDGGSTVFGLFVILATGELGRLEFSHSFAGRVEYGQ